METCAHLTNGKRGRAVKLVPKLCKWTSAPAGESPDYCKRTLFYSLLQTPSLPCFEKLSSKKYLCSIFILMPSFLFSSGLLIDFLIQYFFDWDFQGCSLPNASAAFTAVACPQYSQQLCSLIKRHDLEYKAGEIMGQDQTLLEATPLCTTVWCFKNVNV